MENLTSPRAKPLLKRCKSHRQCCLREQYGDVLIYIQQDATLQSSFYLEIALHVSGGTTTHHQERKQLYLQHLVFVIPLLLPADIAAGSSTAYNGQNDQ
jgi:hypothetical protein